MRRASSRVLTSPTSRRSPSQIANSATEADSGIGNRYVPSRVALVSLRKTCSTWVVATCELIFVSILIDLMGSARGRFGGRGSGQRRHGPGTMTPCPLATAASPENTKSTNKSRIIVVRCCIKSLPIRRFRPLAGDRTLALRASCTSLMQLAEALIDDRYGDGDRGDDEPADSKGALRAEMVGCGAGNNISDGQRADERKDEHAHHAAAHLIGHEFLQQRVNERYRNHQGEPNTKQKHQRQLQARRQSEADDAQTKKYRAAQHEPAFPPEVAEIRN